MTDLAELAENLLRNKPMKEYCDKNRFEMYALGVTDGYNKCKEEIQKNGLALQSDYKNLRKEMRIYANGKKDGRLEIKKELKKTKWHKVSEQVPAEEKQYLLKFKDGTIDVLYVGIDGNLEPFIVTRECFEFYKDIEKWCEIPEE